MYPSWGGRCIGSSWPCVGVGELDPTGDVCRQEICSSTTSSLSINHLKLLAYANRQLACIVNVKCKEIDEK
jgi:hypothetical protein